MDRFEAMRVFVRVVEAGSFTRAARTLDMSRTSVTQQVQRLEAQLRVKLLHRTTRRIKVTEDGAVYYERVLKMLAELDELESGLPNAASTPSGQLRVDVPSPLATLLLVPALPAFHARYPDIQLDMGASDRMVDLIGDQVDCVVRGGPLSDQWLMARHVADLGLHVYAAPSYLASHGTPIHPRDLADPGQRIVCFRGARSGQRLAYVMRRGADSVRLEGRHALAIDDGNAYLAAGVAGLGALWLPDYMAGPHLEKGELVRLFDGWEIDPMPLYLAFPANRHVSKKLRVFIDWVVELMAQHGLAPRPPGLPGKPGPGEPRQAGRPDVSVDSDT